MKRSRMPDRTTPLRTVTPLARTHLRASGPVKARRRDTGPSKKVRDLVRQRAGNACELCGRTEGRMDTHHRRPRGAGGSSDPATNQASNLVLLCRESHRVLESQRLWARMHGWLVPQGTDPSSVAVSIRGQWVYLNDDGEYVAVPQAKEGIVTEKPRFGDIIRNHWAGEKNPYRVGIFIRAGRRTGRLNPGPYWECTDGKGHTWQEGTANHTVEPTEDNMNPLVALAAALERPHLCSPPESHEEAS